MRHAATRSLLERDDVIIVASVSCIYGIGSVETYTAMTFTREGRRPASRSASCSPISSALHYKRNDGNFHRGTFRVRGDTIELFPAHLEDRAWRFSMFGDEIESITEFDPLTGQKADELQAREGLRQLALRDAQADAAAGDQVDQVGAEAAARRALRRRQAAGGAAARAAHAVRHGDDGGDRLVRRHRELLALSDGPPARRAAADAVRVSARQRARVRRREPRHRAADRRHVPRRLPAQGDAGRIRLPAALVHGQSPAALRGMGGDAAGSRCSSRRRRAAGSWSRPAARSPSR